MDVESTRVGPRTRLSGLRLEHLGELTPEIGVREQQLMALDRHWVVEEQSGQLRIQVPEEVAAERIVPVGDQPAGEQPEARQQVRGNSSRRLPRFWVKEHAHRKRRLLT